MWILSGVIRCNLRDISEVSSIVIPSVAAKYRRSWEKLFSELQRGPQWLVIQTSVVGGSPWFTPIWPRKWFILVTWINHESTMNYPFLGLIISGSTFDSDGIWTLQSSNSHHLCLVPEGFLGMSEESDQWEMSPESKDVHLCPSIINLW